MKVQELFEASADPVPQILAAIEAALDRSAQVVSYSVDPSEVFFSVGYDFPEHRIGKSKEVRAVAKSVGKLNAQQGGGAYSPGIDFQLEPKTDLTDEQVKELEAALKKAYPDAR